MFRTEFPTPQTLKVDLKAISENSMQWRSKVLGALAHNALRGAWWLSGEFDALRPEGRRFESHFSRP